MSEEKGRPLPKFGEWDVNDPASAEGFTVIFNKARDEKKTGGKPESPTKAGAAAKHGVDPVKPQGGILYAKCGYCRDFCENHEIRKNGFAACKARMQNLDKIVPFVSKI